LKRIKVFVSRQIGFGRSRIQNALSRGSSWVAIALLFFLSFFAQCTAMHSLEKETKLKLDYHYGLPRLKFFILEMGFNNILLLKISRF